MSSASFLTQQYVIEIPSSLSYSCYFILFNDEYSDDNDVLNFFHNQWAFTTRFSLFW